MRLPAMVPDTTADGSGDAYTFHYPTDDDDQPLLAIVESVAWVKGVDARELEPLHHVIDVDTLNALVGGSRPEFNRAAAKDAELTVTFRYEGCLVTVTSDRIAVEQE